MKTCPHCQKTEKQVKIGHTKAGSQRYLCKICNRKYTPNPHPQGHDQTTRQQAVRLYLDGINQRRIARLLGVSQGSVSNWVRQHADQLPEETPKPDEKVAVAELDELFTFVGDKKTASTS